MNVLEMMDKQDIKELLSKGWITHDAMWFFHSLREVGIEKTNRINRAAVQSMAQIEAARLKKTMGSAGKTIDTFEDLADFLHNAMELVLARFMRLTISVPGKNIIRWEMERDECFAFKGISGMGVIDQYDCGVIFRVESWLKALGISYQMKPAVHKCLMHTTGECKGEFVFNFS